jgi:hypothetical protein
MKTLPHITPKQQKLIRLLYRYRFLQRRQIQLLLGHTDKRRISAWLKDLREKQYIEWIYRADDPVESTKPAIYYLGLNGIRFLKGIDEYPDKELHKRYTESSRKRAFIDRCLLLADGCLNMEARSTDGSGVSYIYSLEADYPNPDNDYHFLAENEFVHPQLCYLKTEEDKGGIIEMHYLLEIFDAATPRYMVQKKLKGYVAFLDSGDWEEGTGGAELPIILIACPTLAELIYAKRYVRKQLKDIEQDDNEDFCIRLTTIAQIKASGMTGGIWEDI